MSWITPERQTFARHALAVSVCAAIAVGLQIVLWRWYIEDAAISFAYARHLAEGDGLVPWVGGERVEGFSNPTWVALLAVSELLGGDAMLTAKWYQLVLAVITAGAVYGLTRECAPARMREAPFVAGVLWASNPQAAIWGASGLENALFMAIEALAAWRLLVELRRGGWPVSAFLWFLLSITRPEGFAYAGAILALSLLLGGWRRIGWWIGWVATLAIPFTAWHAARYEYFAWPWPQTYYAKLETKDPSVLRWIPNRGWAYIRDWAVGTGEVAFVPGWVVGALGPGRWRAIAATAILLLLATAFLVPDQLRFWIPIAIAAWVVVGWGAAERTSRPRAVQVALLAVVGVSVAATEGAHFAGFDFGLSRPTWWNDLPPYAVLLALALAMILAAGGEEGWKGRVVCWVLGCLSIGFAIQALGDWMKGFRWLSLCAVPGAVLLSVGLCTIGAAVATWLRRRWLGAAAEVVATAAWIGLAVRFVVGFQAAPETSPRQVKARVDYMGSVADRLKLEGPITDLDVDMGAHLWWSNWHMYDIAGLIDIPFAQHRFEMPFVKQYVFDEIRPEFVHLHGAWASTSHIPTIPRWKQNYVEIPGYGAAGTQLHVGNHIRRDLVLQTDVAPMPGRTVRLGDGIELTGWSVPAGMAPLDGSLRVEMHVATRTRGDNEPFRMLVFLASADGSVVASWDAAPGYDWIAPGQWSTDETFVGKWDFQVPRGLTAGTYDLGFAFLGPSGGVEGPDDSEAADTGEGSIGGTGGIPAVFAAGEVRYPGVVRLAPREEVVASAESMRGEAMELALAGDCVDAEDSWFRARMHLPREKAFARAGAEILGAPLAACWGRASAQADDPLPDLLRGRGWDPEEPTLAARIARFADARYADGESARAAGEWDAAFNAYSDAVAADPSRSWARRYAEETRALDLGIDDATKARAQADREQRATEMRNKYKANKTGKLIPAPRVPETPPVPAEEPPSPPEGPLAPDQ